MHAGMQDAMAAGLAAVRCLAPPGAAETKFVAAPQFVAARLPLATADGVFEGYASLFDRVDLGGDRVRPGAFAQSLARRGPATIRMLWQHEPAEPVGAWLSVREDARGLKVRGRLDLSRPRGREAMALLRRGALDGLSIGFRTRRAETKGGVRDLLAIDLEEISLVSFPLLPGARIQPPAGLSAEARLFEAKVAARRAGFALDRAAGNLTRALGHKYRPDQPRVPAGNPDGGRWMEAIASLHFSTVLSPPRREASITVASQNYDIGTLVAELPYQGGGRYCVYRFSFGSVIVPGPNIARCMARIPSAGATHGLLLNDN